jgi:hypothetical protein
VHLKAGRIQDAVRLASQYQNLVFFAHALEILLHTVVEAEPESEPLTDQQTDERDGDELLRTVIAFLDYFDEALDVVVRCARKTEMTRWPRLFYIAGDPAELFEVSFFPYGARNLLTVLQTCLRTKRLKTAAQYLLVLHTLRPVGENEDEAHSRADAARRLFEDAMAVNDIRLCRELLRFLRAADDTGAVLTEIVRSTDLGSSAIFA